jgi:ABC-type polysaccharide/polyol phosphate export permease
VLIKAGGLHHQRPQQHRRVSWPVSSSVAERFTDTYLGSHWTMIVSLAAILVVLVVKPPVFSAGRRNWKKGSEPLGTTPRTH